MIQVENTGKGRIRFATKAPTAVEVVLLDGKMYVHSEPLLAKGQTPPVPNKNEEKELDFLKDTKELKAN